MMSKILKPVFIVVFLLIVQNTIGQKCLKIDLSLNGEPIEQDKITYLLSGSKNLQKNSLGVCFSKRQVNLIEQDRIINYYIEFDGKRCEMPIEDDMFEKDPVTISLHWKKRFWPFAKELVRYKINYGEEIIEGKTRMHR